MLCCFGRNEQAAWGMLSNYSIDLGERGVSSVPTLMTKIVGTDPVTLSIKYSAIVL